MIHALVILTFFTFGTAFNFDYEDNPHKSYMISHRPEEEFEPVVPLAEDIDKLIALKNIHCEEFPRYSNNCTLQAALVYNSSRKTPPLPDKVGDWCKAIRQLTHCAIDWNTDCGEVNDNRFDDDSVKGHTHVLENICDDEWYLSQYAGLTACVMGSANDWEKCYIRFKNVVDTHKNSSREQTHYETHFYLCCARARFRRCTLDALFNKKSKCTHQEVITLQKFSTIVSEGDVFQNCDFNMIYRDCPGGDPRPDKMLLTKLVAPAASEAIRQRVALVLTVLTLLVVFNQYK